MNDTKIQWAEKVWNPFGGCKKVSSGCTNCYAETLANIRLKKFFPDGFNTVTLFEHRLEQPLHWRKPAVIFIGSMGDIFHDDVPFEFVYKIIEIIKQCPQHTFMMLTKRHKNMEAFFRHIDEWGGVIDNLWLGVSVENQAAADERIPYLLSTPAAKRFVSYEPALGIVKFEDAIYKSGRLPESEGWGIDLVIMGGESGPNARPMHPEWPRSMRDQCKAAGVPFFFKQWGEWAPGYDASKLNCCISDKVPDGGLKTIYQVAIGSREGVGHLCLEPDFPRDKPHLHADSENCEIMNMSGKKAAGDYLDGVQHHEWPE